MVFTTDQYKTSDGKYAKLFYIELNKYGIDIGGNNHILFEVIEMNDINAGDNFNYSLYYANFGYNSESSKPLCKLYCINNTTNNNVEVIGSMEGNIVTVYAKATRGGRPLTVRVLYTQQPGFINFVYRDSFTNDITGTIINPIKKYQNIDDKILGTVTYEDGVERVTGYKESVTTKDGYGFINLNMQGSFTNDMLVCRISNPPNNTVCCNGFSKSEDGNKACRIEIYNSGAIKCFDVPTNCTRLSFNVTYCIN